MGLEIAGSIEIHRRLPGVYPPAPCRLSPKREAKRQLLPFVCPSPTSTSAGRLSICGDPPAQPLDGQGHALIKVWRPHSTAPNGGWWWLVPLVTHSVLDALSRACTAPEPHTRMPSSFIPLQCVPPPACKESSRCFCVESRPYWGCLCATTKPEFMVPPPKVAPDQTVGLLAPKNHSLIYSPPRRFA